MPFILAPLGFHIGRKRGPIHVPTGTRGRQYLSVGIGQLTTTDGVRWATGDFHALKDIEIDPLVLGLGANRAPQGRIPDDQIGIRAWLHYPFAGIEIKNPRCVAGCEGHKVIRR